MTALRTLIAAAALLCAAPALAQPYVWGAIGGAKLEARTSPDVSGRDNGAGQLGIAWRFNRYLAVEAGYLDVPSYDALTPSLNAFWSADGYTLAAVGNVPLGERWSLVGKVGAWDAKSEFKTVTVPGGAVTATKTDLGSRPLFGLGIEFHLDEHLRLRAIYEQVRGKDSLEFDKLQLFSVGAVIQF
jgi:hypothetical protein